jgi:phosphopantothenoylcysteine decarboxylase/phosphopantothenate--cysteine ligase
LAVKGCDLIIANDVSVAAGTFGADDTQVWLVSPNGVEPWPRLSKADMAARLAGLLAERLA